MAKYFTVIANVHIFAGVKTELIQIKSTNNYKKKLNEIIYVKIEKHNVASRNIMCI